MPFWFLRWDFSPKRRRVRVKSLMRFCSLTQAVLAFGSMGLFIPEWEEGSCAVILHWTRPIIPTHFHFIPKNSLCSKRNVAEGSCVTLDFIGGYHYIPPARSNWSDRPEWAKSGSVRLPAI